MSAFVRQPAFGAGRDAPGAIRTILVVDDSAAQRRTLALSLRNRGFHAVEAASGEAALTQIAAQPVDLILSDWMMPGMDGLELCARVREVQGGRYIYFILLTSKEEKGAAALGLDRGADDFLTKPVNGAELRARINAGERILAMERDLVEKNRLVSATLSEISALYDALDQDLIEARKMQQSLLRERFRDFGSAEVSLLLKPCGHVGGDLVGCFDAGAGHVGIYSIDVSGHGIASALLTARIAGYLSDGAPEHNIALRRDAGGHRRPRAPSETAARLNRLMLNGVKSDLYFTMVLAILDLGTGAVRFAQCGHPNVAVQQMDGEVRFAGAGGLPIGLVTDARFEDQTLTLSPGDRLILYSDGITECTDAAGRQLEEDGLSALLSRNAELEREAFLEALVWDLDGYCGGSAFDDDLSCAMVEFTGVAPDQSPK